MTVPTDATVLVVDDDESLADLFAAWLDEPYTVRTAYDGEAALDTLDETVDVLLLDRRMPGLSGREVLSHVRTEELDVRVAIVSGVSPDFDVIDMGFDEYVVKPVAREELLAVVERLLIRSTYTDTAMELCQLMAARAALESEKHPDELADNESYAALVDRIEDLEITADSALDRFGADDYRAVFRDLA